MKVLSNNIQMLTGLLVLCTFRQMERTISYNSTANERLWNILRHLDLLVLYSK